MLNLSENWSFPKEYRPLQENFKRNIMIVLNDISCKCRDYFAWLPIVKRHFPFCDFIILREFLRLIHWHYLPSLDPKATLHSPWRKRGPLRIISSTEVLVKPIARDIMITAHALRENHYANLLCNYETYQVYRWQEKHNASSFSTMSWAFSRWRLTTQLQSKTKNQIHNTLMIFFQIKSLCPPTPYESDSHSHNPFC